MSDSEIRDADAIAEDRHAIGEAYLKAKIEIRRLNEERAAHDFDCRRVARDLDLMTKQAARNAAQVEAHKELLRDCLAFLRSSLLHCDDREHTPWFDGLKHLVLVLEQRFAESV